jgi:hypothetical protein
MELLQGNSLCSYLKQTKNHFFFTYRLEEQEGGTGSASGVGMLEGGRGEEMVESEYSANTVNIRM